LSAPDPTSPDPAVSDAPPPPPAPEPLRPQRRRNFSLWAYWQLRLAETAPPEPCPVDDLEHAFAGYRERARGRLDELLGPWPAPVPLDIEVLEHDDAGPYTRTRIVFDSESTMSVPAYLLVPHDRTEPGPAVLAIHGHGAGKSTVCGLDGGRADLRAEIDGYHGDYGHQLACRGYVVLAPDLRAFGERTDWNPPERYECDWNLVSATIAGANPLTQNLWDMRCSLGVLAQHRLVDATRMGAVGLSYGGTATLFLAALDDRVKAAVVSGYFSSWAAAHRMPWNMCGSQIAPGLLGRLEHVDLGALVAPRALLVETGTTDEIFPLPAARESFATLAKVYDWLGARQRLVHDVSEGGHQWYGKQAYPFLRREL
jgi:dienelactone hydrolase